MKKPLSFIGAALCFIFGLGAVITYNAATYWIPFLVSIVAFVFYIVGTLQDSEIPELVGLSLFGSLIIYVFLLVSRNALVGANFFICGVHYFNTLFYLVYWIIYLYEAKKDFKTGLALVLSFIPLGIAEFCVLISGGGFPLVLAIFALLTGIAAVIMTIISNKKYGVHLFAGVASLGLVVIVLIIRAIMFAAEYRDNDYYYYYYANHIPWILSIMFVSILLIVIMSILAKKEGPVTTNNQEASTSYGYANGNNNSNTSYSKRSEAKTVYTTTSTNDEPKKTTKTYSSTTVYINGRPYEKKETINNVDLGTKVKEPTYNSNTEEVKVEEPKVSKTTVAEETPVVETPIVDNPVDDISSNIIPEEKEIKVEEPKNLDDDYLIKTPNIDISSSLDDFLYHKDEKDDSFGKISDYDPMDSLKGFCKDDK